MTDLSIKFNNLPLDIIKLLNLYLSVRDIINFCKLCNKYYSITKDKTFLRHLANIHLTEHRDRLPSTNRILSEIFTVTDDIAAEKGYERVIYKKIHHNPRRLIIAVVENGYLDIIQYFTRTYKDFHCSHSMFMLLVTNDHLDIIKHILETGLVSEDVANHISDYLVVAASKGHLEMVREFVSCNSPRGREWSRADIHSGNDEALFMAVTNNRPEIVEYLVSQGANLHDWDEMLLKEARKSSRRIYNFLSQKIIEQDK